MGKPKKSMKERAREKAARKAAEGGGYVNVPEEFEKFKEKKGTFKLDIIPYDVLSENHPDVDAGEEWYVRPIWVHFNVGDANHARICPKTIGKPCPICEYIKELYDSDDEDQIKLAKSDKAKERELYYVIDTDNTDSGIQVWNISFHNFGKQLAEEINEGDEDNAAFAELEGGKTIEVRFAKERLGKNVFPKANRVDFEDRDTYDEDIKDDLPDMDTMFNVMPYDALQAEYFGTDYDNDNDTNTNTKEEEKEEKKTSKSKSKAKPKAKPKAKDKDKPTPKPKSKKPIPKAKKNAVTECPSGGTFATDLGDYEECDDCSVWTECNDAKEALEDD